jgi:hypothetical protein
MIGYAETKKGCSVILFYSVSNAAIYLRSHLGGQILLSKPI